MYWAALWLASVAIATANPEYLVAFVVAVLAVWSSVAIDWPGNREAGIVGLIATLGKLAPLIVIGVAGLCLLDLHT